MLCYSLSILSTRKLTLCQMLVSQLNLLISLLNSSFSLVQVQLLTSQISLYLHLQNHHPHLDEESLRLIQTVMPFHQLTHFLQRNIILGLAKLPSNRIHYSASQIFPMQIKISNILQLSSSHSLHQEGIEDPLQYLLRVLPFRMAIGAS